MYPDIVNGSYRSVKLHFQNNVDHVIECIHNSIDNSNSLLCLHSHACSQVIVDLLPDNLH